MKNQLLRGTSFAFLLFLSALVFSNPTLAGQSAVVIVDSLDIHEQANLDSSVIKQLHKGEKVRASNREAADATGASWYKVRVESGKYGFVLSEGIRTLTEEREWAAGGISKKDAVVEDAEPAWLFAFRAMGLAGILLPSNLFQYGGEAFLLSPTVIYTGHWQWARFTQFWVMTQWLVAVSSLEFMFQRVLLSQKFG